MPGQTVKTITPAVIDRAYRELAQENPYYIREAGGANSIPGLCLRVHRREVQIGARIGSQWMKEAKVLPQMDADQVTQFRQRVRDKIMGLQFEAADPLTAKRRQTVRELYEAYIAAFVGARLVP